MVVTVRLRVPGAKTVQICVEHAPVLDPEDGRNVPSAASIISVFWIKRPGLNITDGKLEGDFASVLGVGGTTAAPAATSVEAAAASGAAASPAEPALLHRLDGLRENAVWKLGRLEEATDNTRSPKGLPFVLAGTDNPNSFRHALAFQLALSRYPRNL